MFNKKQHRSCYIIFVLLLALISSTVLSGVTPTVVMAQGPSLNLEVDSAILVEASTGKVLFKKNEDIPKPPASMTKMMTELLVWEAIENQQITWDQKVKTSEYGFFMARNDGSKVFLNLGEEHTVRALYDAMAIYSANDATVMLAETIAGSEENFVRMMNRKAEELGMTNSHFITSTGYPADELGDYRPNIVGKHYMSARDAAILARELVVRYPEMLDTSSIPKAKFREGQDDVINMTNWNWMLSGLTNEYQGVDGLKTGYTDAAKYCFTGTAERNGIRFITVVMGAETKQSRFQETRKILDYAFSNYKLKTLMEKGSKIAGYEEAEVNKGVELTVPVVTDQAFTIPVKVGEEELYQPVVTFDELTAPLEAGQGVGSLTFTYTGQELDEYLTSREEAVAQVPLVAETAVEKAGWFRLLFRGIGNFFSGIFGGIADTVKGWF